MNALKVTIQLMKKKYEKLKQQNVEQLVSSTW